MVATTPEEAERDRKRAEAHGMDMSLNEDYSKREFSDHPYDFDPGDNAWDSAENFYENF
ncbi:MAG: hypothetical protein ABEJ72_00235 [Candidatus Aenigmatarchaeota archaeon]